jgi:hypothetical protein
MHAFSCCQTTSWTWIARDTELPAGFDVRDAKNCVRCEPDLSAGMIGKTSGQHELDV